MAPAKRRIKRRWIKHDFDTWIARILLKSETNRNDSFSVTPKHPKKEPYHALFFLCEIRYKHEFGIPLLKHDLNLLFAKKTRKHRDNSPVSIWRIHRTTLDGNLWRSVQQPQPHWVDGFCMECLKTTSQILSLFSILFHIHYLPAVSSWIVSVHGMSIYIFYGTSCGPWTFSPRVFAWS